MEKTILIADKLPDDAIESLGNLGCKVLNKPELADDTLVQAIQEDDPTIIIVRSTKVTKEMIENAKGLSLIVRAGAGYNTIDVDAATAKNISVSNCPGKNALAVAELAMGLMLSIDRRIPDNVAELKAGKWNKKEYSKASGIYGRTMAVIGAGNIGMEVLKRAHAFGMRTIAYEPMDPERGTVGDVEYKTTPEAAAAEADVISVHLALTPETRGYIGRAFFDAMKEGATFINTSRAEIVDEEELIKAMDSKHIKAGLDVFAGEPSSKQCDFSTPLTSHPSVYGTHHIGASTNQAQEAVADETVRIIKEFLSSGSAPNCVNPRNT